MSPSPLPPAPGTSPIPEGHVRLWHYTGADPEQIRQQGLRIAEAKGENYGEPNQIWASARPPSFDNHHVVEFSVHRDDPRWNIGRYEPYINYGTGANDPTFDYGQYLHDRGAHVTFGGDIRPEEILAVHEPWHQSYRYLMDNYPSESTSPNEFDWALDGRDPDLGRAVQAWKDTLWGDQGTKTSDVHVPAEGFELGNQLVNQNRINGVLPRGTPIHYQDPRIPDTVYHVTTNLPAVQQAGYLRAGGAGGLGGDSNDRIVSMTLDPQIADQLASDMRFAGGLHRMLGDPPPYTWNDETRQWEGDRTAWSEPLMQAFRDQAKNEGWEWNAQHPLQNQSYALNDWLTHYFQHRSSQAHIRNPLFFGEHYKQFDPAKIGVVPIPRENLNNGALLTDFDLDNPNSGLQEIRSYGDVPLQRTSHVKLASPLYVRWVFSPASGEVTLADNNGDPLDVKYHSDLARELNEPNLVHGYAYRIGDGWRLTDWESRPVEDPFVIAQVMRKLQADKALKSPEDGSWDPSYEEDWDRLHLGLPS